MKEMSLPRSGIFQYPHHGDDDYGDDEGRMATMQDDL